MSWSDCRTELADDSITAPYLPFCLVAFSWLLQGGFDAALGDIVSAETLPSRILLSPLPFPVRVFGACSSTVPCPLSLNCFHFRFSPVPFLHPTQTHGVALTPARHPCRTHVRLPTGLLAARDVEYHRRGRGRDAGCAVSCLPWLFTDNEQTCAGTTRAGARASGDAVAKRCAGLTIRLDLIALTYVPLPLHRWVFASERAAFCCYQQ